MMPAEPTVLTVVLNWRTPDMTLRATEAALHAMAGISGAIVIVDNASGDGSFERMLAAVESRGWEQGPVPVRVVQSGHNGGFGAGNNFGIRAGLPGEQRPDFVYILNSDAFPEPGAIVALRDHLTAHPEVGFVGSFIKGEDGVPHQTAFRFPSVASEFEGAIRFGPVSRLLKRRIVALPLPDQTTRVDWLAGASLMMRMSVLDQIGLFDETFFLYFEETELCRRVARAGFVIDYVRSSEVVHIGSVSTGMKKWARIPGFWLDSRLTYFTKVHGPIVAGLATAAHLAGGCLWRLRCFIQRRDQVDPPHFLRDLALHYVRNAGRIAGIVKRPAMPIESTPQGRSAS